jgi:creatinine amidohydrolase/Fe(II)-dependent formamide hydrolase-like protein
MKQALTILIVCVMTASPEADQAAAQRDRSAPRSRMYKLEELTWPQIDALDRQRTLFILPVGMIEQHGPHLPVGADTIAVTYEADGAARRVSRALPAWNVVMMPAVNYGHSGANQLGDKPIHPGTYAIRQSTLRSVVADLGAQIAQNGFKWIFVMNGHGAPTHNIAINEACDFVSETFRVTMLHLTGLFRADAAIQSRGEKINAKYFSAADVASFGMDVHAGVGETSGMLEAAFEGSLKAGWCNAEDIEARPSSPAPDLGGHIVQVRGLRDFGEARNCCAERGCAQSTALASVERGRCLRNASFW